MNTNIAILALIEIICSISIGVVILFVTYKILKVYGKKKLGIDHPNLAYSIFMTSILFSVGFMVSSVIQPILDSFRILSQGDKNTLALVTSFLSYGTLYILIACFSAAIVNYLGVKIYDWLTPMDEFTEIKNNNIGVGLIVGCIIVVLTLMSKSGVTLLIESIIPYPNLPPF